MFDGDIKSLSLEELQKVYMEDTKELTDNINTLNTGIEKYKESETNFTEEIKKLKLVNYDLFTKVGQKIYEAPSNNAEHVEGKKASIDDILKDFNF